MTKIKKIKIKKVIILLIILCAAVGITLICINKYHKYKRMEAYRYGYLVLIDIDKAEWKSLKKEIMNKYPKIKKIEVIGGIYPCIRYSSRSELNKEDTEKIFEKTRKLILRPDVYETFAQDNLNKIVRFNKILIEFTTFQSEEDYSTFECTSDNAEDGNDVTSSNKSIPNRYPQYDTFNTWDITYKGKKYVKHIPAK